MSEVRREILLVEDSETQALATKWALEEKGFKVSVARDGAEGLRLISASAPDLILSDVIMPVMDGYALCREVRKRAQTRDVPVILITRMNEPSDILKGLASGADSYITKPFDTEFLTLKIRHILDGDNSFVNRARERAVEVSYGGESYAIGAGRARTLSFLLSTYENVIWQNQALIQAQGELRALNERLEVMVEERTAELKGANERLADEIAGHMTAKERLKELSAGLEKSNAELEMFACVASHSMQEPLRMVSGYLNLIEKRYAERLDEHGREFVRFAIDGARRMDRMIKDLLSFARIETFGTDFKKEVDSREALNEALENLRLSIEESGASIICEALPKVRADRSQLAHIFQNLLSNSIKFRAGEPPRVHVCVRDAGEYWVFSVSDNGTGFDMKENGRLFNVFSRLHGHDYPGTGIGLAACRRIVERHGGAIWAHSEPGKGSTFHFSIPRSA